MDTDARLAQLEAKISAIEAKRQAMLADHLALRAAFVAVTTFIASSEAAQHAALKSLAMHQLANQLLAGEFPTSQAEEATAALEELFYEIAAARTAGDPPPAEFC